MNLPLILLVVSFGWISLLVLIAAACTPATTAWTDRQTNIFLIIAGPIGWIFLFLVWIGIPDMFDKGMDRLVNYVHRKWEEAGKQD